MKLKRIIRRSRLSRLTRLNCSQFRRGGGGFVFFTRYSRSKLVLASTGKIQRKTSPRGTAHYRNSVFSTVGKISTLQRSFFRCIAEITENNFTRPRPSFIRSRDENEMQLHARLTTTSNERNGRYSTRVSFLPNFWNSTPRVPETEQRGMAIAILKNADPPPKNYFFHRRTCLSQFRASRP